MTFDSGTIITHIPPTVVREAPGDTNKPGNNRNTNGVDEPYTTEKQRNRPLSTGSAIVRAKGVEPSRQSHRNLNPARLPVPPRARPVQCITLPSQPHQPIGIRIIPSESVPKTIRWATPSKTNIRIRRCERGTNHVHRAHHMRIVRCPSGFRTPHGTTHAPALRHPREPGCAHSETRHGTNQSCARPHVSPSARTAKYGVRQIMQTMASTTCATPPTTVRIPMITRKRTLSSLDW